MSAEIFNTATWNFLSGNRDVERIIMAHPGSTLVVRGGIASVLPTVNCLRDMRYSGWRDFPLVPVQTPKNTLTAFSTDLNASITNGNMFSSLLKEAYGVKILNRPVSFNESTIVVVDDISCNKAVYNSITDMMNNGGKNELILIMPDDSPLSPGMRRLAESAGFSTCYEGNNVFFPGNVEEALMQREPEHIILAGISPLRLFYSAIGAVDYLIVEDSRYRNPGDLQQWDLLEIGKKVAVMGLSCPYGANGNGNDNGSGRMSLKEAILKHLRSDLKVLSTDEDFRFTPVPGHKIAIDMM